MPLGTTGFCVAYKADENYKPDESEIMPEQKMEIDEFLFCCKENCYSDDDGIGEFATETMNSGIMVSPSQIIKKGYVIPESATHVIWHNK